MPTTERSAVLTLDTDQVRLIGLGLYELQGGRDEAPASHERLRGKLSAANRVLRSRGWVAAAERALVDPDAATPYEQARDGDSVPVRILQADLELALAGLQAFLDRDNPAVDRFSRQDPKPLIDPAPKVKAAIAHVERAVELLRRQAAIAADEQALLA